MEKARTPADAPDLADVLYLLDEKDTPAYSMVRKGSAPKDTFKRSRWQVEVSPENFQDTEWGWDEYK
jgi:hypothetical protein